MKDRVPNWVIELANKVARIPFAKKILKPLYYPYKRKISNNLNKKFKLYALEVLETFDKCMNESKTQYTLIFGTLLGAIREEGFIGHDFDIDVAIFFDDRSDLLLEKLKMYGFTLSHRFSIGDGHLGCEETYIYKDTGVAIDIFYIHKAINEYPYVCCWNFAEDSVTYQESMSKYGYVIPRRIELPINRDIVRVNFESIQVSICSNAHQISEFSYGPNYMIPDPNYKPPKEHRIIWVEKLAEYKDFH